MWDRQYLSSVMISAAVAITTISGIVSLLLWLGWLAVVGIPVMAGGFLAWFYWGPRPDLRLRGLANERDVLADE